MTIYTISRVLIGNIKLRAPPAKTETIVHNPSCLSTPLSSLSPLCISAPLRLGVKQNDRLGHRAPAPEPCSRCEILLPDRTRLRCAEMFPNADMSLQSPHAPAETIFPSAAGRRRGPANSGLAVPP